MRDFGGKDESWKRTMEDFFFLMVAGVSAVNVLSNSVSSCVIRSWEDSRVSTVCLLADFSRSNSVSKFSIDDL